MGIRCDIYRSRNTPPKGAIHNATEPSLRTDTVTLVSYLGKEIDGPFDPNEDAPAVVVVEGPYDTTRALEATMDTPGEYAPVERPGMVGPMFGGTFIYTSDGRFPEQQPIKLHDRYETPEHYATYD